MNQAAVSKQFRRWSYTPPEMPYVQTEAIVVRRKVFPNSSTSQESTFSSKRGECGCGLPAVSKARAGGVCAPGTCGGCTAASPDADRRLRRNCQGQIRRGRRFAWPPSRGGGPGQVHGARTQHHPSRFRRFRQIRRQIIFAVLQAGLGFKKQRAISSTLPGKTRFPPPRRAAASEARPGGPPGMGRGSLMAGSPERPETPGRRIHAAGSSPGGLGAVRPASGAQGNQRRRTRAR